MYVLCVLGTKPCQHLVLDCLLLMIRLLAIIIIVFSSYRLVFSKWWLLLFFPRDRAYDIANSNHIISTNSSFFT